MQRRNFLKIIGLTIGSSLIGKSPCRATATELTLHAAKFWQGNEDGTLQCMLCPNNCRISEGNRGRCKARINRQGKLYSLVYGNLSTIAVDPIEKKPVFHVLPGSLSLSVSAAGCVLSCRYCQNWQISQATPEEVCNISISPQDLVKKALDLGCKSISYTYNEPTVFYEFMYDTAVLAKKQGLKNIMVSCGYINEAPLQELIGVIDVIKVDFKGFSEEFYQKVTRGRLEPVLNTIKTLAAAGKLMDIVCLIVPGLNDDEDECRKMFNWLAGNAGDGTSLFLSRFYPTYQLKNVAPTPVTKLEKLKKIAHEEGLKFVYIGNVPGHDAENTYCPNCNQLLIQRLGYLIRQNLIQDGGCSNCGERIPGIWD